MKRLPLLIVVFILLSFSTITGANPGGVGDGDFDMQCGGACHGDSSQNQSSPALLELTLDNTAYVGLPVSISATISGVQFSSSDTLGLFLITDTTGHSDLPEDAGWSVISDQNGGDNNYVEVEASSLNSEYSIAWTLKPSSIEATNFYLSIHHGGENAPFFGISSALSITPQPVPDNLPRLTSDYTPKITRDLGDNTTIKISTLDVEQMQIEWRLVDGESVLLNASSIADGMWQFELPAALQPSIIEWRAIMKGDGPDQTTPWFRIAAQEPALEVNQTQVYLQALALSLFFIGLVLTLHNKFRTDVEAKGIKELDQTQFVTDSQPTTGEAPPLPESGLPDGWTMEQWKWYGDEYLEELQ